MKRSVWCAGAALLLLCACSAEAAQPQHGDAPEAALVRSKIKHVFVIYQENHTFDNYFGTYPGAENLTTQLAHTHGFRQYDPIGKQWVSPFRITDPDTSAPSQNREVIEAKMDGGAMDKFVETQEAVSSRELDPADAQSVGLVAVSFYDCDTVPFLWKYAHTFALFDHYFEAFAGPSTPNNVEIIAGQEGESQAARYPADRSKTAKSPGNPIFGDLDPAFGPDEPGHDKQRQIDQRYATLMLSLGGSSDALAHENTDGVREDLAAVAKSGQRPIPWGWYQEGYHSDSATGDPGYEAHHNAPQYFGYLRNNDVFWKNEHDLRTLLTQLRSGTLPDSGVFYVKGSSRNQFGWKPRDPDPSVQKYTLGDDDHPGVGDSDHEVGEAFVATFVNAIARSKYWKDSAILITWDDAGGYYDHVPPPQFEHCPDGNACGDGPRLPLMILSPYAKSGAVVHDNGDTASVLKFVEAVFGTAPLASLPDEKPYLPEGPRDGSPSITNLLGAFDAERLRGLKAPIAAPAAEIPDAIVNGIPVTMSCATLGIKPASFPGENEAPRGYSPRTRQLRP